MKDERLWVAMMCAVWFFVGFIWRGGCETLQDLNQQETQQVEDVSCYDKGVKCV